MRDMCSLENAGGWRAWLPLTVFWLPVASYCSELRRWQRWLRTLIFKLCLGVLSNHVSYVFYTLFLIRRFWLLSLYIQVYAVSILPPHYNVSVIMSLGWEKNKKWVLLYCWFLIEAIQCFTNSQIPALETHTQELSEPYCANRFHYD